MDQEPCVERSLPATILVWVKALPGNVQGALLILLAAVYFSLLIALIKFIGDRIPISQILFFRQLIMFIVILPLVIRNFPQALVTHHPWHHASRTILALIGMFCGFTAFVNLPLADATTLWFSRSFFVTIFAIVFLKEVVGVQRWAATLIGFAGVVVMLKPIGAGVYYYALLSIISAAASGLIMVIIRSVTRFDNPITILFYQTVFVGLLVAPLAAMQWVWPTSEELMVLLGIGALSITAHTCSIHALRLGEASVIAPMDYTRLIWAVLIGILIFDEVPSNATIIGATIMISALLYTIHHESRST